MFRLYPIRLHVNESYNEQLLSYNLEKEVREAKQQNLLLRVVQSIVYRLDVTGVRFQQFAQSFDVAS